MQISESRPQVNKRFALFALAFRPFFLIAGVSAVILMLLWLSLYRQGLNVSDQISGLYWHAHEMIFGYTAAVIAGFLLTAVRNWTGVQTLNGTSLGLLSLLWLSARVLRFTGIDSGWLALIDIAFLVLVAAAVACPIVRVKQWKNLFFVPLLLLYAAANGLFYSDLFASMEQAAYWSARLGLGLVLIIITIMAGRVVGFFIERGLNQPVRHYRWANWLAVWATAGFVGGQLFLPDAMLLVISLLAAAGHVGRLVGWYQRAIWSTPLLWVLFLGYGWMGLGFVMEALHFGHWLPETLAIHAFTVGVIGVMTLGMMARVALGHTGRPMQSHQLMNVAFVLINLAPFIRVFMPILMPELSLSWVQLAGVFWVLAFAVFSWIYLPVLVKPRVDGAPG